MRKSLIQLISVFFCLAILGVVFLDLVQAARPCIEPKNGDSQQTLEEIAHACEGEINKAKQDVDNLNRLIDLMEIQERATRVKISQTTSKIEVLEEEIAVLSSKIFRLDDSLTHISKVYLSRVNAAYKMGLTNPILLLFSSKDIGSFVSRYKYLQEIQIYDRNLLLSIAETKQNYDEQKQMKEKIQKQLNALKGQLEAERATLDSQIAARKKVLDETKGKQAVYEKLLSSARSELIAITGILAGQGREGEVRKVAEGERIAALISGASCNSSGTHLHFMVSKDGNALNPLSYLKGGIEYENCSGSSCGAGNGDSFNPAGGWNWPLSPKIVLNQGFGPTWATRHTWVGRIYSSHNGIDIKGSSLEVKAVKSGTLYQGSYIGINCNLPYVRVHHDDGYDTFYLHVNY